MAFLLRPFQPTDSADVTAAAIAAFEEFRADYGDWPTISRGFERMSALAAAGEMIVATVDGSIAGAVTYVAPGIEKQEWFDRDWPVIRMLVVRPEFRGQGIGRALTEACVRRARRDGASVVALHTSPILDVAFAMYGRMGFTFLRDAPPRGGVPYGIYVKRLDENGS